MPPRKKPSASASASASAFDPTHVTTHGAHKWYQAMFEKFGWMILCKSHGGVSVKIQAYKEGLDHLVVTLDHKAATLHDKDRKENMAIMAQNARVLQGAANTLL